MQRLATLAFTLACFALTSTCAQAQDAPPVDQAQSLTDDTSPLLQKGDRLVLLGDSITAMSKYSVLVDLYLAACRPDLDIWLYQDAISGETTAKFLRRLDGTLERTRPTIVTSFYGFNDGGWVAYKQENADRYEADTRALLGRLDQANVRVVLASTSIAGDKLKNAEEYNDTLRRFRDIAERIASDTDTPFADVNTMVHEAQRKMRAREDQRDDYDLIARDGAHADWPAHVAIATAMLRGLGLGDEPIAQITFDHAGETADASDGHRIVSVDADTLTVESSRFPFFFLWTTPGPAFQDMPKVAEEIGFFDDLNRFNLVVKGLAPGTYDLTWGKVSQPFTAEQLEAGVNLAHQFQRTPFDAVLYKLWQLSLVKATMNVNATIDAVYKRNGLKALQKQLASQLDGVSEEEVLTMIENDPMTIHNLYVQAQRDLAKPIVHQIVITAK